MPVSEGYLTICVPVKYLPCEVQLMTVALVYYDISVVECGYTGVFRATSFLIGCSGFISVTNCENKRSEISGDYIERRFVEVKSCPGGNVQCFELVLYEYKTAQEGA